MSRRWLARLRYYVERLGAGGAVGIGLLAFSAVFYVSAVMPAREQRDALELRRNALSVRLERLQSEGAAPAETPALKLARFLQYFPPLAEAPRQVLEIHAAAAKNQLRLENGEYRMIDDDASRLMRYEIRLPIKGPYVNIRRFLLDALSRVPGMTLDGVSIKRETIGARNVDAKVQFSVLLADVQ